MLFSLIVVLSFSLTTCGGGNANFNVSVHADGTQSSLQSGLLGQGGSSVTQAAVSNAGMIPSVFMTFVTMMLGVIVLMTIPFRNKEEWENGQFQMIAMGDHGLLRVELARFVGYLLLTAVFVASVMLCFSVYTWKYDLLSIKLISNGLAVVLYWSIAFLPLLLAFGIFVSAINTAYYRDGGQKLLLIVKYISCAAFFILVMKVAAWFGDPAHNLLPPMSMPFDVPEMEHACCNLNWEFPILSLVVAAAFIFWSGKILEEVEA